MQKKKKKTQARPLRAFVTTISLFRTKSKYNSDDTRYESFYANGSEIFRGILPPSHNANENGIQVSELFNVRIGKREMIRDRGEP